MTLQDFFSFPAKLLGWTVEEGAKVLNWQPVASTDHSTLILPITTTPMPPESATVATQPPYTPPSPFPPKIVAWATAVAHWEGANPLSCNPGNLKYSTLTASWGGTKGHPASDGGFLCQFLTYQAGFKALCNFLQLAAEGELIISHPLPCSIEQFTVKYAGNPKQGYKTGILTV